MATEKPGPSGSGNGKGKDTGVMTDRVLTEAWRHAPTETIHFNAGATRLPDGTPYKWPKGDVLEIDLNGEKHQVMSNWERACSYAMVEIGFQEVLKSKREGPFGVIECGFGMGLTSRRVMRWLNFYGGWYDLVELNDEITAKAREFADQQNQGRRLIAGGTESERLPIRVFQGDAAKALEKRAQKIVEGREQPSDVLILDTYPLKKTDSGINDLKYLDSAKRCVAPNGVIIVFLHYPGSTGGITKIQEEMIAPHFQQYTHVEVPNPDHPMPITPGPGYKYLWTPEGYPVTHLSIGVLKHPKL